MYLLGAIPESMKEKETLKGCPTLCYSPRWAASWGNRTPPGPSYGTLCDNI
jgi:hypothetical protein